MSKETQAQMAADARVCNNERNPHPPMHTAGINDTNSNWKPARFEEFHNTRRTQLSCMKYPLLQRIPGASAIQKSLQDIREEQTIHYIDLTFIMYQTKI